MNVCLVHIRISVAPGGNVPSIYFKSNLEAKEGRLEKNFTSLAEYHASSLAVRDQTSISPMKPSKTKAEVPEDILLNNMSESEKNVVAKKLIGQRDFREVHVSTYSIQEVEGSEEKEWNQAVSISKVGDIEIGASAKNYLKTLDEQTPSVEEKIQCGTVEATTERNIQDVISEATKQLLERSSNSISSTKDDNELSEILQMSASVAAATSSRPPSSLDRPSSSTMFTEESQCRSPGPPTTSLNFFSGNPAVEITHGIVHLYKTNYMMMVNEELPPPTNMLCMVAVPATIDTHIVLEFTSAFCDTIKRLQIIRDRTPSQYMVLMTFSSEKAATNFFLSYNNTPFSSLTEDDLCHLAFVATVDASPSLRGASETSGETIGLLPIPGSTELPDCVLCLERMDESVRGVLTVLCNHSFHGACLQKWEDLCCPVCRYIQTPEPQSDNKCLVCGSVEDLWICLICGHVGCGRYTTEHAQQHYLETHHNFAMALNDNRVWDYAGDYFVHRLFQNKEDGKLVEQKAPDSEEREAKIEAIQLECMYLLTSQLDSQRKYWEERLAKMEEMAANDRKAAHSQLSEAAGKCNELHDRVAAMEKEKSLLERRNQQLSAKYASSLKELSTEQELNEGLRKNQDEWRAKVKMLEELTATQQSEIHDMKEQLRDLMFFLEAQKTLTAADEETKKEIQDGQIVVGTSEGPREKRRPKNK